MKKKIYTLCLLFIIFLTVTNGENKYKLTQIFVLDRNDFDKLVATGVALEGAIGKIGDVLEIVLSETEISLLQKQGFAIKILIDDLSQYYSDRLFKGAFDALGFGYGSMGGYYTYTEIIQQLDSMKILYPSLITAKQIIGTTVQGRAIYAVKISDNPEIDEPIEPSILFTALTHSREPQGMMTVIYYMWWLLQNYGTNAEVTYLVNNRQMYFIPIVSADGYVYNQTTNPNGGGLWRKNRRLNSDGSYGVDLNRNFGPYEYWNAPNGGSSTTPSSETYRGTAPFSEPEDQAIRDFLIGKRIKACLNYHTYSNLLIYPYGALVRETPDSLIYREMAKDMTAFNKYRYGTDQQTVGYATRGNSDDFMYDGDIPNNGKIFAMTPEVGSSSDGFWPATSRILPLAQENLFPNKYLSNAVGSYPLIIQRTIIDSSGDGYVERGEKFLLRVVLRNKGLDTAKNISVQLTSSNSAVQILSGTFLRSSISPFSSIIDTFRCKIANMVPTGINVLLFATTTDQTGRILVDTIPLTIGKKIVRIVFSDSATYGTGNWNVGTGWGTTTDNYSPPFAFTDSPTGQYANNANNSLTLVNSIKLAGSPEVKLRFYAKWAIEANYDFATVEASSNGGSTWTPVQGKYTRLASGNGVQTSGTYGYDGTQNSWIEEEMDVTQFASSQFKFRFRLRSDVSITSDGFYVDDINLVVILPDTTKYRDVAIDLSSIDFGVCHNLLRKDTIITISNLPSSNDSLQCIPVLSSATNFLLPNQNVFKIAPGNTYQLPVSFIPTSAGNFLDTLLINHNATSSITPIYVYLSGSATQIQLLPMLVVTNIDTTDTLYFGLSEGATDGIDQEFGEIELEPVLPLPAFDVRWLISGTNGVKKDIRQSLGPNYKKVVYKCAFQSSIDKYPVTISWKYVNLPDVELILSDGLTNGSIFTVNMKQHESITINNPDVKTVVITCSYLYWFEMSVVEGWNLLSLPLEVTDARKSIIYPTAVSDAFVYNGTYTVREILKNKEGYWLKYNSSGVIQIYGKEISNDTIYVNKGWNLIGVMDYPIAVNDIQTDPANLITSLIYTYNSGYKLTDTLLPSYGYWVKVDADGKLILSSQRKK